MNKPILTYGDTVCIIACSDGITEDYSERLNSIVYILRKMGLETVLAKTLFRKNGPFSGSPQERASEGTVVKISLLGHEENAGCIIIGREVELIR